MLEGQPQRMELHQQRLDVDVDGDGERLRLWACHSSERARLLAQTPRHVKLWADTCDRAPPPRTYAQL